MKSALIRLATLLGASLMLWMSTGAGVALAGKTSTQPTNPGQFQYTEHVKTLHKHGRHRSTTTTSSRTSTGAGETTGTHAHRHKTATGHHKTRKTGKTHHKNRKGAKSQPGTGHRSHAVSSKNHAATGRLTAAVTTGSGGGISAWLLVVLILVLVSGSVAGILRYRRNH